jgi:hypothetical protein
MIINYERYAGEKTVQIKALLLPESIHRKLKQDAANGMRTITAQAVAVLINNYESDREGEKPAGN